MEIIPFPNKIFIKPDKADMGAFTQIDSRVSESGVVTHVGHSELTSNGILPHGTIKEALIKVGDKVMFKAWGMDVIEIEGQKYFVADLDRKNLLCKIQDATT